MRRKDKAAIMAVYERLNKLSGMVPSNPCDIRALARLSRTCNTDLKLCMWALFAVAFGDPEEALEIMETK